MGFTIPKLKTPVPPNEGNEVQSFEGMLNQLGSEFINKK